MIIPRVTCQQPLLVRTQQVLQVPIAKQYVFSMYWMASTLSTASLVGLTTPKNEIEILFTIMSMVTTLTFYAYGAMQPLHSCMYD
jgi:hypothetical protein